MKTNNIYRLAREILSLIRLRLSLAVTFSAVTGYLIFPFGHISSLLLLTPGIFLLACAASVMNQVTEYRQDGLMERTRNRPIPSMTIGQGSAVVFSAGLLTAGLLLLYFTGWWPVILGLFNMVLYNLVYTRLKKVTQLALIPGAMVGAIPPLIGFTAAGGTRPTYAILLFSCFMFLWQLPHFWLILMKYRDDYARAGFKTLPKKFDEQKIRNLIFLWVTITTAFLVVFFASASVFGRFLASVLIVTNIMFIILFYRMIYYKHDISGQRKAYVLMNSFGLMVMLLFIINALM